MYRKHKNILRFGLITSILFAGNAVGLFAQGNDADQESKEVQKYNIKYSDSGMRDFYTIRYKDSSETMDQINFLIDPKGGRAVKVLLNGKWNKSLDSEGRPQDIIVGESATPSLDFVLGTYTDLRTNLLRPVYNMITNNNQDSLEMRAEATIGSNKIFINRIIKTAGEGRIYQTIILSNAGRSEINLDFEGLAFTTSMALDFAGASFNQNNVSEFQYFTNKKLRKASINSKGGMTFVSGVEWISAADNFFLNIINPNDANTVIVFNSTVAGRNPKVEIGIQFLARKLVAGEAWTNELEYYIGPRSEKIVKSINPVYKKLFAWPAVFNPLIKPIELATLWLLNQLFQLTGNIGITLILIALLVKLFLLPLSFKSAVSMKKLKALQPKLNKLQEKWGHEPQVLQQKTMELYKEEKVNPFGGCLPLLLQIPVFFALFRVLSRTVELRGAGFLWIKDLTMTDSLFTIGSFHFNLLPLIMTLLQLLSVFLQQGRMTGAQNDMQKQMQIQGYLMPVIFLFLFWNMPAGLVLYWTVQNIFSIAEQELVNLDSRLGKEK
ncbi:MAG: YidC/Oxa1 family insertase periplasmic-domain containing protein [Brevinemataceae bacterium]